MGEVSAYGVRYLKLPELGVLAAFVVSCLVLQEENARPG